MTGSTDCQKALSSGAPASGIVTYRTLVTAAKDKARNVTVASIPPPPDSPGTQEFTESVNAGLLQLCQDQKVTYSDNTDMFTLKDGSVNDGYFGKNGHLTPAATTKMLKNIGVTLSDIKITDRKTPEKTPSGREKLASTQKNDRTKMYQQGDRQEKAQVSSRTSQNVRCFYCGESGHVKASCYHGRKIQCHTCKDLGHKVKFCT